MAYYAQGGPFEDFTGGEATNSSTERNEAPPRAVFGGPM